MHRLVSATVVAPLLSCLIALPSSRVDATPAAYEGLFAVFAPHPLSAQAVEGSSPDAQIQLLRRASSLLRARDFAAVIEVLTPLTESDDVDPRAWSMLGQALQATGELEGAIAAFRTAAEAPLVRPRALWNLGLALTRAGRIDEAFAALEEAKATGSINMTDLDLTPAAAPLRGDPRYRALFPTPEELATPFLEDVEVLAEWVGEAGGDQFGWIARNVGDVDGDGAADVAVSAPTHRGGDGKIYVFSSGSGAELWSHRGRKGENLGLGVGAAGDVDGDDVPDVVAGAPRGDRTLVFSGRDGTILLELEARQAGENHGRKVAGVGDVDGDDRADLLVGAPWNDAGGEDAGRAYVVSGRDGSVLHTFTGEGPGHLFGSSVAGVAEGSDTLLVVGAPGAGENGGGAVYVYRGLHDDPTFLIESDATGVELGGMFVSVVGDVDGDGHADVYGSDWSNRALGPSTGRIYVHSGANGERLFAFTGEAPGDGFGIGTADVGDVDGDGHADLLVGAWQHASHAPSGGKTYLFSGRTGEVIDQVHGLVAGETYGFDTTGMGDVNGDGVPDFLVTSAWSSIRGSHSGRVFILSGATANGR